MGAAVLVRMIGRRALLSGMLASVAVPLVDRASAQPAGRVWRVGYLSASVPESDRTWMMAFEQGLRDLGYVVGKDVIVAFGGVAAAKQASATIPIVMTVHADPVGAGIATSLARPGGQVTGLSDLHGDIVTKRLELLKTVAPSVTRVAVLFNPAGTTSIAGPQAKALEAAAPSLGVTVIPLEVRSPDDIERAFARMSRERAGAVLFVAESTVVGGAHRGRIAALAIKHRLRATGC